MQKQQKQKKGEQSEPKNWQCADVDKSYKILHNVNAG